MIINYTIILLYRIIYKNAIFLIILEINMNSVKLALILLAGGMEQELTEKLVNK